MALPCSLCHCDDTLFYLPGKWEGGLCEPCALEDPVIGQVFREHFGVVARVSDGDAGRGVAKS